MSALDLATSSADPTTATILCVDDEPNVLSALSRTFRRHGYRALVAGSGQEALALLDAEPIGLVISDMRMPVMDGAMLMEQVRQRWPFTMRLLLTGHADMAETIEAINRGEIHRYITKPWDEHDLLLIVRHALERRALEDDRRRLQALTESQNEELRNVNASLEAKVLERTAQLREAYDELQVANGKLKASFLTSIKVFANLIELRETGHPGHSRRVADFARRLARRMGSNDREVHDIFLAGLLHGVGMIGLAESARGTALQAPLDGEGPYRRYPARGEQALMPFDELRNAAKIIRSHRERFDGRGFPDGLVGPAIPIGARILAVAKDYDALLAGIATRAALPPEVAKAAIVQGRGSRYDPEVIATFLDLLQSADTAPLAETRIAVADLKPGMVLSRDLLAPDGVLLLAGDYRLDEALVERLRHYQSTEAHTLLVFVRTDSIAS